MSNLNQPEIAYFLQRRLDVQAFLGTWYIVSTNLNFWKERYHPSVTYTVERTTPSLRILDEVQYVNHQGVVKRIVGYDRLLNNEGSLFQWVGKPWYLRLLKSTWGVVDHDDAYQQWAVTYFSRTAVTPAGMDIYARTPQLAEGLYRQILDRLQSIAFLEKRLAGLFRPKHAHEN